MTAQDQNKIEAMREGGSILASVLDTLASTARPGLAVEELDKQGERLIREAGAEPSFKGYQPAGADQPYPASICLSLNDEVVHGLHANRTLKEGDLLSIDAGVYYKGFHTDSAVTVAVGTVSQKVQKLLQATRRALQLGIDQVGPGATTGDIGNAIEAHVKEHGFQVIQGLAGHGIGAEIHEELMVLNEGTPGKGAELQPGMTFAIEPMVTTGSGNIILDSDGFTYKTADGTPVAHFEHTVAVTKDGVEVLTKR